MTERATVRVGQVWASNDPREPGDGRQVRISNVDTHYAHYRSGDSRGGWNGRAGRAKLDSFRTTPARSGFRLVEDVPEGS